MVVTFNLWNRNDHYLVSDVSKPTPRPGRCAGRARHSCSSPIDNVFVSSHFAKIDARTGSRLDSDHLPVISDITRSQ